MFHKYTSLAYFQHRLTLADGRWFTRDELEWCEANCTGRYSNDHTCPPFSVSFENECDMLMFKLMHGVGKPWKPPY